MHIMIFEDDKKFAKILSNEVRVYFQKLMDSLYIDVISMDFSLDIAINADIAFIDIDLYGKNGIVLAKYIKNISPKTLIIFVSSKEELVFNALSVSMFQFIRKSKFKEDCIRVFRQLYQHIQEREKKILLQVNGKKQ